MCRLTEFFRRRGRVIAGVTAGTVLSLGAVRLAAQPPAVDKAVLDAEAARVAVVKKVMPAAVAVCEYGGEACGSGVLIDPAGYAITNHHVYEALGGPVFQCGLSDGILYDAVVVGLDPVGDIALIKLLPKEAGKPFPVAELGDSDTVRPGEWTFTMGNPHGFALDFTPSVAYGMVSGTNRYLKISPRSLIEYTDAIQVETAVNPGNSGGPLFDAAGRVIGINSAASVRRGGANAGLGISVSINQVKNFLGHLRAGLSTDHATLGAAVETLDESGLLDKLVIREILDDADAFRRGLRNSDQLTAFAGRPLTSLNQYRNVLGLYPKGWRVPVTFRRPPAGKRDVLVRLMGSIPAEKAADAPPGGPPPKAPPPAKGAKPPADSAAAKLYKAKPGFANYHFNEVEQARLTAAAKHGDFTGLTAKWAATGTYKAGDRNGPMTLDIADNKGDDAGAVVALRLNVAHRLEPLKRQDLADLAAPVGSGGLMMALYHHRRLLTLGAKGFEGEFTHGGKEPFYPPADGKGPADARVMCDVLRTKHGAVECKWYFRVIDAVLLGCETALSKDRDPCEVYFADYKPVGGKMLPHRVECRYDDKQYGVLTISTYDVK